MSYACIWLFRLVDTVVTEMGGLHIAVNNAGMLRWSAAEDTNHAEWDATFELNSKSVFICCQVRPVPAKHQLLTGLTVDPSCALLCTPLSSQSVTSYATNTAWRIVVEAAAVITAGQHDVAG